MLILDAPINFIARPVLRLISRVQRMRSYHRVLRRAAVGKEKARAARSTWWGGDPRWYPGGTPPRQHNLVTPLIDGQSYFTALRNAIGEAQHYIYIAGWCLTPNIPLCRDDKQALVDTRLLALLSEAAERVPVRILLWSGATAIIQPTARDVKEVKETIETEGRGDIICRLDHTAHPTHCHHQKAIVIDGRVAFVGGMDLTTFSGDRWDVPLHPLRAGQNWHDVQLRIEGEAVADVEHNFRQRWEASGKERKAKDERRKSHDLLPNLRPTPEPSWHTPVQIARTVPEGVYDFAPRGEFGIYHFYMQAIRRARRFIYLENQYIWSPHVMDALLAAMNARHDGAFRILIVLPAYAGYGRWNNDKHVNRLRKADKGRGIISIYSLYASGPNIGAQPFAYRPVYVHAKVAVIDDEWLTVGSANLNNRGLITDGEMNAVVRDTALATHVRTALWSEHLELPPDKVATTDVRDLIDRVWPARAEENAEILQHGERPLVGAVHRYLVNRKPSDLVLEDIQSLAFEH